MKFQKYLTLGAIALSLGVATSCVDDLNVKPDDPNKETEIPSAEAWYGYFGSLYGNLLYEGNLTPNGVDGGAGTWMRCHWNLQEIVADEAIISNKWNDPGYFVLNMNTWLTDNMWVFMAFQREANGAKQCAEFISIVDKAVDKGIPASEVAAMKAEAMVLHAYNYYYMIDLYGKGPWVSPNAVTGATPPLYDRQQLFDATVAELQEAIPNLIPASQQLYGRLSQEAGRMLLAKLYLNAEVYTGTPMYDKCAEQCKIIMQTIPNLVGENDPDHDSYKYLFCATNDRYVGANEIIWAIPQKVGMMETWGGTTYMTAGAYIETVPQDVLNRLGALGAGTVWSGLRMRPELSQNLIDNGGNRNLVYVGDFNMGVEDLDGYDVDSDGYMCVKYTYTTEEDYYNTANATIGTQVCETDFPLFRLADTFLMLSECQARGVQGADPGYALFNRVRARAGLDPKMVVNLDEILKERQSELYWEGHRRSDLIRFGKYVGGTYNWSWKGGTYEGIAIPAYRALYPIPYQYVSDYGQNPGY